MPIEFEFQAPAGFRPRTYLSCERIRDLLGDLAKLAMNNSCITRVYGRYNRSSYPRVN